MSSVLELPDEVRETAGVLYRKAAEENILIGRSMEAVASASLHVAARQSGNPRTLSAVGEASRVSESRVSRAYNHLRDELNLGLPPASPLEYVPQIISDLDLDEDTEQKARELLREAEGKPCYVGKNPPALAAASIYAASLLCGNKRTQADICDVADVTPTTIRNHYENLIEVGTNRDPDQVRSSAAPSAAAD